MSPLTKQAQELVDEFKKRIENLPEEERAEVIKKMTESIATLHKSVERAFKIVKEIKEDPGKTYDPDHLRDFI